MEQRREQVKWGCEDPKGRGGALFWPRPHASLPSASRLRSSPRPRPRRGPVRGHGTTPPPPGLPVRGHRSDLPQPCSLSFKRGSAHDPSHPGPRPCTHSCTTSFQQFQTRRDPELMCWQVPAQTVMFTAPRVGPGLPNNQGGWAQGGHREGWGPAWGAGASEGLSQTQQRAGCRVASPFSSCVRARVCMCVRVRVCVCACACTTPRNSSISNKIR